ncbi:acetyl-CoA carboxylase carboxyl transferase subunit beta [Kribbella antiqua]|uniref:Acetyl-CoA carboxylase carboxyl transferase subunit beta n=1 Tax=Kribbella antiqua TaxID=2512217 RepID=A0A4R2IQN2_9ACTN|nr:carboxyl transferase domain-containing protein [Kribbella antiqua]TCO47187.1 acetyl-CoA carboxylase carboxyl transferase subunit beta [Kribbella antiqua]
MSTARELLDAVLDPGSFESWDQPAAHDADYLRRAAERAGTDEAVLTGRGLVQGRAVAVLVSEFAFLAGSIGMVAAARITSAVRRATAERLPIVASTASGGTRMQEGAPAFVEMINISKALMEHKAAGLPYLVHLRHPTTGGVFASWGSLGHVTVAEPGALIGFLGPKVYEAMEGIPFPPDVQTAENLAAHGVIDGVVDTADLPFLLDRTLGVLVDPPVPPTLPRRTGVVGRVDAWESVLQTRRSDRAGVQDLLRYGATGTVRLTEPDASVLVALTRLDGQPCVVVGQDRSQARSMGPAALRAARRGMNLAQALGVPLVTVIDTAGAELSPAAEEGGLAGEIAQCIATMATITVPTLSVLLGQGTGGGALALLPATTVLATEHAWLAPLPPEGASAIMHRDITHAAEMAAAQHITATELHAAGTIHHLIPEQDSDTPESLAIAVAAECAARLSQ